MQPSLAIAAAAAAAMIPLAAAAGRQPLFLYGTLMDIDVLAQVLGRPVDLDDLLTAEIEGFRRLTVRGTSYPLLLPAPPGEKVEGRLLRRATARDILRVNHFESGEYRAALHPVRLEDGRSVRAWLYLALDHLRPGEEPWELPTWQRRDKADLLAACPGWMADCPEPGHGGSN